MDDEVTLTGEQAVLASRIRTIDRLGRNGLRQHHVGDRLGVESAEEVTAEWIDIPGWPDEW